MFANLTALVRSTDAWRRFEIARFRAQAYERARAELLSYRSHELASDLGISSADIDALAAAEADRRTELFVARKPAYQRPQRAAVAGHIRMVGA
jgi:uncharacterized protein YjiS (DUF1127 family)